MAIGKNTTELLEIDWLLPLMVLSVMYLVYYHVTVVRKVMKSLAGSGAMEGYSDYGYANRFQQQRSDGTGCCDGSTTGFDTTGAGASLGAQTGATNSVSGFSGGQKKSSFLGAQEKPVFYDPGDVQSTRASRRVKAGTYVVNPDGTVVAPSDSQGEFDWNATDKYGNRLFYNVAEAGAAPVWVAASAYCGNVANASNDACTKWYGDYAAGGKASTEVAVSTDDEGMAAGQADMEKAYFPPEKKESAIFRPDDRLPTEQFSGGVASPY